MTLLFRYLGKEIFIATVLSLAALLALFAVFDAIRELGDVGKNGYSLGAAMTYVLLSQPNNIVAIFPVAALLGTLWALSRMSGHSELTVMRTSGLPLSRLAVFVAMIGFVFMIFTFVFGEVVAPSAQEWAKRLRMAATRSVVAQEFRSGFWVKDERSFINIQLVTADTELINMRIYDFDSANHLTSISIAKKASYSEPNQWTMHDLEKTTFAEGKVRIEKFASSVWHSALTPDILSVLKIQPSEMSMLNLSAYIDHLRENKQTSTKYELAMWGKLFNPLAVVIMMLLAIPFAIQSNRKGGAGGQLLLGVMIGLGFMFLNQLITNLTVLNNWPPLLSASIPALLFFVAAIAMLVWKERPYHSLIPV